eukprot:6051550-Amphidinium_carterae.1
MGEKKTWRRLVACKADGHKSKAEELIKAAMARCGMKPPVAAARPPKTASPMVVMRVKEERSRPLLTEKRTKEK